MNNKIIRKKYHVKSAFHWSRIINKLYKLHENVTLILMHDKTTIFTNILFTRK